jgi:hypothetical protein
MGTRMDLPRGAEIAAARGMVIAVGVGYLAAQLLAFSADRAPGWDEAIYLSQVSPGAEPLPFAPSRARGITLLVAPVLQLGGSIVHVRLFLVFASAAALTACFRMWAPVLGFGAPAAALLFAGSWPALFYGSEVMPNLWAAFPAVAAVAVLARRLTSEHRRADELVAGGLIAVMALIRPLDALVLTAVLVLFPLLLRRGSFVWSVHLGLGLAAGWAPWLVEMLGRFDGLLEAAAAAARLGHAGGASIAENVQQYLALSDGPTAGPAVDPRIPRSGLFWLLGMTVLTGLGILVARRRGSSSVAIVPLVAGLVLAAVYVAFTSVQAPRFLVPALALLAIPAGLGLADVVAGVRGWRSPDRRWVVAGGSAVVLTFAWAVSQHDVAATVESGVIPHRASAERAGLEVRGLARGGPCVVFSEKAHPMVGYAAGCGGVPLGHVAGRPEERMRELRQGGSEPFQILERRHPPEPPSGTSRVGSLPAEGGRTWFVFALR